MTHITPIIIIAILIFSAGCTGILAPNKTVQTSNISPGTTVASLTQTSIPIIPKNVSEDQAKALVRNSTGKPDLNLTLEVVQRDYYILKTADSAYYVSSSTGHVYVLESPDKRWKPWEQSKSLPEIIDLDQGQAIAEAYAKYKYPELFMETTTHRIVLSKSAYDNGQYRDFTYTWDEELYYPDNQTPSHETIRGLNGMSVVLSPYTGGITSSYKWEYPLDANLSLVPTLSEENAAVIAKSVFASKGVTDILPSEWTPWGLCIMTDQNKTQHLTWAFDVTHRMGKAQYLAGGVLYIDAHNGSLVASTEIG